MRVHLSLILVFPFILLLLPHHVHAVPTIDGNIQQDEWKQGLLKRIELDNGEILNLTIIYTSEDILFLATLLHNKPGDEIILDPTINHDYFGIEFDNNHDEAIMGTSSSPDDTLIVNYDKAGASDMFMHGFKAYNDVEYNGNEDVEGYANAKDGILIWEVKKPLNSGDVNGYDINLKQGDVYKIMVAFWDDKPPHTAAGYINRREGNSQFITMVVGAPISSLSVEIAGFILLLLTSFMVITLDTKFLTKIIKNFDKSKKHRDQE
ncbi:MAG: hypothetical protein OEZ01_17250 [Candidatus Heimdallarchaeota archaeon]|nr:hypothetical protein [Candidatus Heimdallarchaeota archaeon]MDH5647761.1 hypothetical protein [Candidatus Heimdallarchaeota archaeon]